MTRVFGFWCPPKGGYSDCCRGTDDDVRIWNVHPLIANVHRQKSKKVTS